MGQPAAPQTAPLGARHRAVVRRVVVTEEMQHAVQRQDLELREPRVAKGTRLPLGPAQGNDDVAELHAANTTPGMSRRGRPHGKRQHVGHAIHAAKSSIERPHAGVAHQRDGQGAACAGRRGNAQPARQARLPHRPAEGVGHGNDEISSPTQPYGGCHGKTAGTTRRGSATPRPASDRPPRSRRAARSHPSRPRTHRRP